MYKIFFILVIISASLFSNIPKNDSFDTGIIFKDIDISSINPDDNEIFKRCLILAEYNMSLQRYDIAIKFYKKSITFIQLPELYNRIGNAYLASGNIKMAVNVYKTACFLKYNSKE